MELTGLVLGIGILSAILLAICFVLYQWFPLPLTQKNEDGKLVTTEYRHEVLIFFVAIFLMVLALFIPQWSLEAQQTCEVVLVNASVQGNDTLYSYANQCFQGNTTTIPTYLEYYSRTRWFMWTYLGIYMVVGLFYYIKSWIDRRRYG